MRRLNQTGSGIVVVLLGVVVIAVVAFAAFRLTDPGLSKQPSPAAASNTNASPSSKASSAAELQTASDSLDATTEDDLNAEQFDTDVDSLL